MTTSRRDVLTLAAGALAAPALASPALAASASAHDGPHDAGAPEELRLWPGTPPGGPAPAPLVEKAADQSKDPAHPDRFITGITQPRLIVYRPQRPNGSAVLLMPGGGYQFLSYDNEGVSQARWLNARGITAFILLYRLPGEGWAKREDVPLQDAQRAMRLIRAQAEHFGIQPNRVAIIGFSAGGHLAGSLATRHAEQVYAPVDEADRQSARPDLAGLVYPVISLSAPFTHAGSRDALLGPDSAEALRRQYSVDQRVDARTPPCFFVHAGDDGLVPPANSISCYSALQALQRPAELHIFSAGGHGFGVRLPASMTASAWPQLFTGFAVSQGIVPAA
ncbi:alpha/beta hydrolase [Novosphingobium terrae]|uniref:alpha/beta hydrolase n=1 Tax=Novosphingobium terrae TaxID=2726189 RepID=UPI001980D908|nr:alpha/beta hydrolase [Novosphingobium terrae]